VRDGGAIGGRGRRLEWEGHGRKMAREWELVYMRAGAKDEMPPAAPATMPAASLAPAFPAPSAAPLASPAAPAPLCPCAGRRAGHHVGGLPCAGRRAAGLPAPATGRKPAGAGSPPARRHCRCAYVSEWGIFFRVPVGNPFCLTEGLAAAPLVRRKWTMQVGCPVDASGDGTAL
jgi:hypothetical protein